MGKYSNFLSLLPVAMNDRLRDLTEKEIKAFFEGNPDADYTNAAINAAKYKEELEIPRDNIQLNELEVLGEGRFGLVVKGYVKIFNQNVMVAVKKPKDNVDVQNFLTLLSEIKIMSYLDVHENVVQLVGANTVSIKKRQVLALLEYSDKGDLKKFLMSNREKYEKYFGTEEDSVSLASTASVCEPSVGEKNHVSYVAMSTFVRCGYDPSPFSLDGLLRFSTGIAKGMTYLSEKHVIHGDLSARNVLLTKDYIPKISDFGLAHQLVNYSTYVKEEQAVIPWMWMSIEALKDKKFSVKSDVWSFGVTLYEIFTLGEDPYPAFRLGPEFVSNLVSGYRMDKPVHSPQEVYNLMLTCWKKEPNDRPTFELVLSKLNKIRMNEQQIYV